MKYAFVPFAGAGALAFAASILSTGAIQPPRVARSAGDLQLEIAKIYFEYNSSDNDLGVHVFLDGEDWKQIEIENPDALEIFEVKGKGPYSELGLTELFFEGAEPRSAM